MSLAGTPTTHGIPNFAAADSPALHLSPGLVEITQAIDALIGVYLVQDVVVDSPVATIDFTSIPQTFKHLEFIIDVASDNGGNLLARMNNDAAANYDRQMINVIGAAVSSLASAGSTSAFLFQIVNSATTSGSGKAVLPNYTGTTFWKQLAAEGGLGGSEWDATITRWRSASAVNRVTFLPSAGNFRAGSRITMYGRA